MFAASQPCVCGAEAKSRAQHAIFTLNLNGIDSGEVEIVIEPKDVLIRAQDLAKTRLRWTRGKTRTIDGGNFISLRSLAPDIVYKLDEKNLTLSLTATPGLFHPTDLNLFVGAPEDMVFRSSPSGFFNYSVTDTYPTTVRGFFEGGLEFDRFLLYSGLLLNSEPLVRGLTNLTWDDPANLRRLILGDSLATPAVLGGSAFIGGLNFQKDFSLNPYFIQFPTQSISGAVTAPSTAYVYRNGLLIDQVQLAPGNFNLAQIPGVAGVSDSQVVIRDAFGGSQAINAPYYVSTQLLSPGLSSYQYSAGFLRNNLSTASWEYGPLALSIHHFIGITPWLTPGFRLEATAELISAGPELVLGFPIGEFDLALAASRQSGAGGAAASVSYQYLTPEFSIGTQTQWMAPHYSTLSLTPDQNRPTILSSSSASYNFSRVTIGLQHVYSQFRTSMPGESTLNQLRLSFYWRLKKHLILSATVARALPGNQMNSANQAFFGITYIFNKDTVGSVSYAHDQGLDSAVGSLQKGLPIGPGYGYLLQAQGGSSGAPLQQAAMVQYQNDYGYYEGDYTHLGDQHSGSVTVAGGIIGIGGRLFFTRPVQNGFALVRVSDLKGVRCEWSHQEIGVTDHAGDCLFPNLLPYFGNQLGIDDKDIPLDFSVGATHQTVAVPYRGGAVIRFPVHRIHQVSGSLVVLDGTNKVLPSNGQLTVHATPEVTSPIRLDGEFYFEDIAVGRFKAEIEYKGASCAFDINIPEFTKPLLKMGVLTCTHSASK